MMESSVPSVDDFFAGFPPGGGRSDSQSAPRAVMRVLTTQVRFVIITVALPARAPASIDSMVVSFLEARPALRAAFSNQARDHSYQ